MSKAHSIHCPSELAGIAEQFEAIRSPAARAHLASALYATLATVQAVGIACSPHASKSFRAHPLDVLILSVVEESQPIRMTQIYGHLADEKFLRNGQRVEVSERTLKRRLAALVDHGALSSASDGYRMGDEEKTSAIESIDFDE